MKRIVQPELLDVLRPDDPLAIRSRRDLRRVNSLMGNPAIMARALKNNSGGHAPKQITELGAGDGNFLLAVAQKISTGWPDVNATLLDLQKNISSETLAAFSKLGWRAEAVVADVFDWPQIPTEIVVANLFLHHFENARLASLLDAISRRTKLFIAIEPRRATLPFLFSQLLWLIGCNSVTQHDAPISVRAGFSGDELSALWPDKQNWWLTEQRVGAFSHLFIARRKN
jgi:hypothetical protein